MQSYSTIEGSGDDQPSDGPEYFESSPRRQMSDVDRVLKAIQQMQKRFDKLDDRMSLISLDLGKLLNRRPDLKKFQKIGRKSYYIENTLTARATGARKQCEQMGAKLAIVENENEFNALTAALTKKDYWLGITRVDIMHVFRGNSIFFSWLNNEPNNINDNENCVELRRVDSNYGMNDDNCNANYHFICEMI